MYELIRDTVDRSGAYYPEETETIGIYSDLTSISEAIAEDYDETDAEIQFHYDNVWIFIDTDWIAIYHTEKVGEGA